MMSVVLYCFLVLPGSVDCGDIAEVKLCILYVLCAVYVELERCKTYKKKAIKRCQSYSQK